MSVGDAVEQLPELNSMARPCLFTQQDWGYIPLAVHASLRTRRDEMDSFKTVWKPWRCGSSSMPRPHCSRWCTASTTTGKAGGKPGHWALARYITLENEAACGYLSAKTVRRIHV